MVKHIKNQKHWQRDFGSSKIDYVPGIGFLWFMAKSRAVSRKRYLCLKHDVLDSLHALRKGWYNLTYHVLAISIIAVLAEYAYVSF